MKNAKLKERERERFAQERDIRDKREEDARQKRKIREKRVKRDERV
jgi:hypothetical protein